MKQMTVFQNSHFDTKYIFFTANFFCPESSVAPLVPHETSSTLQKLKIIMVWVYTP